MPLTKLVYCVAVVFKITERADQLHQDIAPAHSTALVLAFLAKHHITQLCQPFLQPRFAFLRLLAFPKATIAVEREVIVNVTVTQYTSSVKYVSLPTD